MDNAEKTTLLEREDSSLLEDDSAGSGSPAPTGSAFTKMKGVAAMLAFTLTLSISKICVQALNRAVPDFELNAMRCGFSMIAMVFYFLFTRTLPAVSRGNILPVFLLTVFTNLNTIGCYVAVTFIPIATADCITLTAIVVSGLTIFKFCNKEEIKLDKVIAAPLCVVGLFLVLQPPGIFPLKDDVAIYLENLTNNENTSTENILKYNSRNHTLNIDYKSQWYAILGYGLATSTGILDTIQISTVKIYDYFSTTKNLFISFFWSHVVGTILSLILMVIFENPVFPTEIKDILFVIVHVCTKVFVMPLQFYGSLLISGNLGSIIRTTNLLFVLAAQYTILKDIHPGHRNWIEIFGVILVLFGTIFCSLVEIHRDRSSKETAKD